MAGWLGDGPTWESFESCWGSVLERFGVPEFKSSDLVNRRGNFEGWPKDQCAAFLAEVLAVVHATDITGVTVVVALEEPEDEWAQARRQADYTVCAAQCIALLSHIAEIKHSEGRVAFIFDERQKVIGELETTRQRLRARLRPALAKRVGPATFDSSLEILPLQIADLLVYWAYLRRQHELELSSERGKALLDILTPVLAPKVAISRTLSWEPGYLHRSTAIMDPQWKIEEPLPDPGPEWFSKPRMPESSKQAIWDASWKRLRRLLGRPDD